MTDSAQSAGEAKHELANLTQQKLALQHMLARAADEIEELVESDCAAEVKDQASKAAERFRKAAEV